MPSSNVVWGEQTNRRKKFERLPCFLFNHLLYQRPVIIEGIHDDVHSVIMYETVQQVESRRENTVASGIVAEAVA